MLELIGKYRTAGKMTTDMERLYDRIYEILEKNEYYQEITSLPEDNPIDDFDADVDINDEWETPSVDDENFDGIDIDKDTSIFDEEVEPFSKPYRGREFQKNVDDANKEPINHTNKNFNPHRPGMGAPEPSVEDEPIYEFDEEQLMEAILDVFGKVETFGKEPFSMPGGGTRQYATQKPKAWGTEVAAPESEVTEEPADANQELKPKADVIDKSVYIKGLAESIAKEIKKKV